MVPGYCLYRWLKINKADPRGPLFLQPELTTNYFFFWNPAIVLSRSSNCLLSWSGNNQLNITEMDTAITFY